MYVNSVYQHVLLRLSNHGDFLRLTTDFLISSRAECSCALTAGSRLAFFDRGCFTAAGSVLRGFGPLPSISHCVTYIARHLKHLMHTDSIQDDSINYSSTEQTDAVLPFHKYFTHGHQENSFTYLWLMVEAGKIAVSSDHWMQYGHCELIRVYAFWQ